MADFSYYEVGAWSQGYSRGSRFFWISDIDTMLLKLAEYEHNIHFRRAGAQNALQAFKNQQNEMVESIREVSFISSYSTMAKYIEDARNKNTVHGGERTVV